MAEGAGAVGRFAPVPAGGAALLQGLIPGGSGHRPPRARRAGLLPGLYHGGRSSRRTRPARV